MFHACVQRFDGMDENFLVGKLNRALFELLELSKVYFLCLFFSWWHAGPFYFSLLVFECGKVVQLFYGTYRKNFFYTYGKNLAPFFVGYGHSL